jgi:hypothetical protein
VNQSLKAIGEELSEIVSGSTASSPDVVRIYLKIRAYLNSRLCLNLKAIGEELVEIVSGSTASLPDTDVAYVRKHGPVRSEGRVNFRKQLVYQSLKAIGEELSEIVSGSTASSPM